MLAIFSGFICALMMGFFILRYQDNHHRLTGDHDFNRVQKFHITSVPRIGGAIVFLGISVEILIRYSSLDKLAFDFSLQLLLASIPAFLGGLVENLTKRIGVKIRLF